MKVSLETPFIKKSYHIEITSIISKQSIDWFLLYDTSFYWKVFPSILKYSFFSKIYLFSKNKIIMFPSKYFTVSHYLFILNSSKWKALFRVEYYVNCYVYFNRLLLLTSFLLLTFYVDYFSYLQLYVKASISLKVQKPSPFVTYDWVLKFHISKKSNQ